MNPFQNTRRKNTLPRQIQSPKFQRKIYIINLFLDKNNILQ